MKKRQLYQISILVATAILAIGCSSGHKAPKPVTHINKPAKITPVRPTGVTLSQLNSGGITKLALKGPHNLKNGEPINFIIDTRGAEGYLYIVYADSKGETGVLYPNPNSPLSEVSGKYIFPRDFGNMAITATKDCQGCEKDRTVIYALLSKEPIIDIQKINQAQLANIVGGAVSAPSNGGVKSKGISANFNVGRTTDNSNVNIGVFEFFVK